MKALIVGASSGLGRALAEELARRSAALVLVASDSRDLEPLAADLHVRFGVEVETVVADARDAVMLSARISASTDGSPLDGILLPLGAVNDLDSPELAWPAATEILAVNFLAPVAAIQAVLPALRRSALPVIVGFGSIASVRGRERNSFYAAAKRALLTYFEALRHQLDEKFSIRFYVLGYLDTNLAFGRTLSFRSTSPRVAAQRIVSEMGRGSGVAYLPRYWYVIALVLRLMPWRLFRRVKA